MNLLDLAFVHTSEGIKCSQSQSHAEMRFSSPGEGGGTYRPSQPHEGGGDAPFPLSAVN